MTGASTDPRTAAVRAAAEQVPDPELPAVTLGMLGVVEHVRVQGDRAEVVLLPTWVGCPAVDVMVAEVATAVAAVAGIDAVDVGTAWSPVWTPARISPAGHAALRAFGIAAPVDVADGRRRLPVVGVDDDPGDVRTCPWCRSGETERQSVFGPTPCRDVRHCNACRQPFEAFRRHDAPDRPLAPGAPPARTLRTGSGEVRPEG